MYTLSPQQPQQPKRSDPFSDEGPGFFGSMFVAFLMYFPLAWGPACIAMGVTSIGLGMLFWVLGHAAWWYLCVWRLCVKRGQRYCARRGAASFDAQRGYTNHVFTARDLPASLKWEREHPNWMHEPLPGDLRYLERSNPPRRTS